MMAAERNHRLEGASLRTGSGEGATVASYQNKGGGVETLLSNGEQLLATILNLNFAHSNVVAEL